MQCSRCNRYELEVISATRSYCPNCGDTDFNYTSPEVEQEKKELRPMAGKRPSHRLVIGKRTVGVLWDAVAAKSGLKYFSGNIDVTELKSAVAEKGTIKKSVRVNREGATAEHDMIRVALFEATNEPQKNSSSKW